MALNLPEYLAQELRRSGVTLAALTTLRTAAPGTERRELISLLYDRFPSLNDRERGTIFNAILGAYQAQQERLVPGQTRDVRGSAIPAIAQASAYRYSVVYSFSRSDGSTGYATAVIPSDRQLTHGQLNELVSQQVVQAVESGEETSGAPAAEGRSLQDIYNSVELGNITLTESL